MEKIDYKKKFKELYSPSAKVISIVDVPEMKFLTAEGSGYLQEDMSFKDASEALVRLSYTIKFIIKRSEEGIDYISMPLEGRWIGKDNNQFCIEDKANANWTLAIMQPEFITEEIVYEGIEKTWKKKNMQWLDRIRLCSFCEGLCVQLMHTGPYEDEGDSIDKLQAYMDVNRYEPDGSFHEIYLGDPRRARPENLRTIVRQPIKS